MRNGIGKTSFILGLAVGLALASWTVGCGAAKAEPLDVTYYYLPG